MGRFKETKVSNRPGFRLYSKIYFLRVRATVFFVQMRHKAIVKVLIKIRFKSGWLLPPTLKLL